MFGDGDDPSDPRDDGGSRSTEDDASHDVIDGGHGGASSGIVLKEDRRPS